MPSKSAAALASLVAALMNVAAPSADAADLTQYLARPSRLGGVFADPPARIVRVETVDPVEEGALFLVPPNVPGYYGRPTDFSYRNYYGTSPLAIFGRLPYACGFHGYC